MAFPIAGLAPLASSIVNLFGPKDNTAAQNLKFQRDMFNEQKRLATAPRTDAFGNTTRFDGTSFTTDVTPQTQAILSALQGEELASLTRDAPRQREAAERMDKRSQAGHGLFEDFLKDMKNRRQRPEEDFQSEETLFNIRERENSEPADILSLQATRMGNTDLIPRILQSAKENRPSIDAVLKGSRELGTEKFLNDRQTRTNFDFDNLIKSMQIGDRTVTNPIARPNYATTLSNGQNQSLNTLLGVLGQGSSSVGNAILNSGGSSPNYGGVVGDFLKVLGELDLGQGRQDFNNVSGYSLPMPAPNPRR